jgi:hypothetical protein
MPAARIPGRVAGSIYMSAAEVQAHAGNGITRLVVGAAA